MAGFVIEDLESGKVRQFHWNEVEDLPCDGSATLLDVRTAWEYQRGHLACRLLTQYDFTCAHPSGGYSFYQVVTQERQTARSAYPCGMEKL